MRLVNKRLCSVLAKSYALSFFQSIIKSDLYHKIDKFFVKLSKSHVSAFLMSS